MDDFQRADQPMLASVAGGEEQALLAACRVALVDGSAPESGELPVAPGATLNARVAQTRHRGARVYVAVSALHDYAVAVLAHGPVEALEQPELADAPVGAMLLTDSADGREGVVCAERVLDGGWVLRGLS